MEEQNIQLNTFEGGMDMDTDAAFMSKNTYRYSQNMRLVTKDNGTNGIIQSIEYIKKYAQLEELDQQNIISVISARVPNDNFELVNTAIILTQDKMNKSHNHIYLVTNFNSNKLSCKCILKTIWHITKDNNITMVFNYETRNVYKLYVNDPISGMKIINLAEYNEEWGDKPVIENSAYFNSNPTAILEPLKLKGYTTGNLKAGAYQYFYKLYTASGIETTLSPGSEVIYLAKNGFSDATESGGYLSDTVTGYGISLKLAIDNEQFDYMKCYRVYWKDNINEPEVELFYQDRIKKGHTDSVINDSLQQVLNKITLAELNDIIPYTFYAQNMLQYKNRLFFANIESFTWDIPEDYDTRAYRANSKGLVRLINNAGNNVVDNIPLEQIIDGSYNIEKDFDAINPMNGADLYPVAKDDNEYAYDRAGNYGGEGKNISFTIVSTETFESIKDNFAFTSSTVKRDYAGMPNYIDNVLKINPVGGSNKQYTPIYLDQNEVISYSNPIIASKFASYQRDEVYRFGIIFYNSKNISTPVHWICDIRFPSGDTDGFSAFIMDPERKVEVVSRPLGINFEIKNFPEGAVAAEIVRCDRTFNDRTIVAQGMLNNSVYFYDLHGDSPDPEHTNNGASDIRCPVIPTMLIARQVLTENEKYTFRPDLPNNNDTTTGKQCPDVKLFASPETCINPDQKIISAGQYIVPVYRTFTSRGKRSLSKGETAFEKAFDQWGTVDIDSKYFSGGYMFLNNGYDPDRPNANSDVFISLGDKGYGSSSKLVNLIKYYIHESANTAFKSRHNKNKTDDYNNFVAEIEDSKIARRDLPYINNDGVTAFKGTYIDNIGGKAYTNNAVAVGAFCIAGINCLISVDTEKIDENNILYNGFSTGKVNPSTAMSLYTLICNIKQRVLQYGGASYLARSTNAYISCGGYIQSSDTNVTVFGGDTFLVNFNYQNASIFSKNDFNEEQVRYRHHTQVYLPLETTINTWMRSDDYYMKSFNFYLHTNPGAINGQIQDTPMYVYNSAYSVSDGGVNYMSGSTNTNVSNTEFNRYRIVCTETKAAGEAIDSWSKSKFANTLDLDSKYGSITSLIEFKNQMLALQENALSQISVDDRALITDQSGAALVLGTGGILNRYDVIISNYGAGIVNDPSVISSSQNIYWYDNNKNVICAYGSNGFHILSKEKKVQSFLNSLAQINNNTVHSFFNDKDNELWMEMKGTCLVYNEQSDCFTSFYTHVPEYGLRFYDRLVTLEGKQFYHTGTFGEEDSVKQMTAKLTTVVNENPYITKVFDSQIISGNLIDPNDEQKLVQQIRFSTKTQDSFDLNYKDIQCREDSYRFAIPRQDRGDTGNGDEEQQTILNRSFSPRMRGKYLNCEYTFNCDNDRSVQIPFIKTTFRLSNV